MLQCRRNTKTSSERQKTLKNSSAARAYLSARRRNPYVWNHTERPSVKLHDVLVGFYLLPRGVCPMLRQKATSQMEQPFLFAHRSNIERYERLLQTHLTDHERAFIQRRLDEERGALALLYATDVA